MKRRLFWKILLAFWLTLFAITQGVWLAFELTRNSRPPPDAMMAREVAPVVLAAGAEAVAVGGPVGLKAVLADLPPEQRRRVALTPGSAPPPVPVLAGAPERLLSREVTAPGGETYRLTYRYAALTPPAIFRSLPPPLLFLGLVGGLLFSAVLAWYLTEPIRKLRAGFDRLARGDLEVRLAPSIGGRRDEIADLGRDFDMMAQRLQQLVAARDRLLHDVSHELRSPLARLQLAIGLARKNPERGELTLQRIEREAQRLETLVREVLALARAEHGQAVRDDYFDLPGVVATVAEDACFEAEASGVRIHLRSDLPDENTRPLMIGNAELVHRAMENIIRNALRFSSAGQAVEVNVSYDAGDRAYRVEIADHGPGVPNADVATMFDPFVRGEHGGPGLGLGLSIASRAILAHGGTMAAHNRDGGGFVVTTVFPVPAQPAADNL